MQATKSESATDEARHDDNMSAPQHHRRQRSQPGRGNGHDRGRRSIHHTLPVDTAVNAEVTDSAESGFGVASPGPQDISRAWSLDQKSTIPHPPEAGTWKSATPNEPEQSPSNLWKQQLSRCDLIMNTDFITQAVNDVSLADDLEQGANGSSAAGAMDLGNGLKMDAALALLNRPQPLRAKIPAYTNIDVATTDTLTYGTNKYQIYDPVDHAVLTNALVERCHSLNRLLTMGIVLPETKETALPRGLRKSDFGYAPEADPTKLKRRVVAIDCEMYGRGNVGGKDANSKSKEYSEIIQLCAIDVVTGEVLIEKLVKPAQPVVDLRSRWHGVTYASLRAAERDGAILKDWKAARAELFKFIDSETVIMGHSALNDLDVLRLYHLRIVDTSCLTAEAVLGDSEKKFARTWSLAGLVKELLGFAIQVNSKGHDCTEDALATRELALWAITHPEELKEWADREWTNYLENWIQTTLKNVERDKRSEDDRLKNLKTELESFREQVRLLQEEKAKLEEEEREWGIITERLKGILDEGARMNEDIKECQEKIVRLENAQKRLKWHVDNCSQSLPRTPTKKGWAKMNRKRHGQKPWIGGTGAGKGKAVEVAGGL